LLKIQSRMKRRILELESLLLSQKNESTKRISDLAVQHEEKSKLIRDYENARVDPEKTTEAELGKLKSALDQALHKNRTLQLQLEVSENSQKMARESTIELMKSSQQQATQFVLEHSKQSVEFVKSELRQEQLTQQLNIIENYKIQIADLECRLNKEQAGSEKHLLQQKFSTLQQDFDELYSLHSGCEPRFRRATSNLPPSIIELDRLTSRIQELELSSKSREALLTRYRKVEISNYDQEKENMAEELKLKESQIRAFQIELSSLINAFTSFKSLYR
jgi:hypothetical protein